MEQGRVSSIRGDELDVHSKGHICPKAMALRDVHEDPLRVRQPLRRRGDQWEVISWKEAFDTIEERIGKIQREHGRDALGVYTGNPTVHNTGTLLHLYDFFDALGTRNQFASHSLDQLPLMLVCGEMFGHLAMFPVPDLARTQYLLMLGANPMVSNGSLMSTPGISATLRALKARSGRFVVIDPMRTRTAELADEHLFIRPGTDVFFLLAIIHVMVKERLCKPGRLEQFSEHLEELYERSVSWTVEWAEAACGIPASDIERIAREFATAERAVAYGRLGVSVQEHGTLCQWAIVVINLLSGNLDREGGSMFSLPAVDFLKLLASESKSRRWHSRVRKLPETGGDLPSAALAEEILEPGPGQIKAMITIAGNPLRSAPNSAALERAFSSLDFMVAIDLYRNESTRHAHIILPPLSGLEVLHYGLALHLVSPSNHAHFSEPALPRAEGSWYDHEILRELQRRLGKPSLKNFLSRQLGPELRLDLALRTGPYGVWSGRFLRKDGLSLRRLKKHPHGVDLGALKPQLPGRLFQQPKRIPLLTPLIRKALDELKPSAMDSEWPFLLIGRRHLRSNNSWMHHMPSLQGGKKRCTLLMHPGDAAARGFAAGQMVRVRSRSGQVELELEIAEGISNGVLSIPHGWGHEQHPLIPASEATRNPGANANALTADSKLDEPSGTAVFNGVPVRVEALE